MNGMMQNACFLPEKVGPDDLTLITRYREGDESACTALLARYANLINRRIAHVGVVGEDSDDLRQEAYMGLMGAIRSYNPQKGGSFSGYAARCIGNRLKNLFAGASTHKAKLYRQTVSIDDIENEPLRSQGDLNPESIFLNKEAYGELKRLMGELLSDFEKDVLFAYLSGCDYKDIAAKLRSSQKSVDNALQRARRKLKAVLNNL